MTDNELVLRKLAVLREHVRRAERRRAQTLDVLRDDVDLQDALAMSVLVAIQEAIDIAFHIATDEGFGIPDSNAHAFELLASHHVIRTDLSQKLARSAGLRNRMAHGYASLELERLWQELPSGLTWLTAFATDVARWLGES